MNTNELDNQELERVAILSEECGEVVQIIGKVLRHGFKSWHPNDSLGNTNRMLLEEEIADVFAAVQLLQEKGIIDRSRIDRMIPHKVEKKMKYLHHKE